MAELQTTGGAVRPKTTQNPFSKISPPVKYTRSTQFHNSPTKGHKKHQSEKPATSSLPETTVQSSKKTAKNKNGASSKKSHRAKEVGGGSDGGPVISNSTSPSSNSLDHLIARHQQQQQRFSQVTPPAPPAALSAIINEQDDGQQAEAAVAAASRPTRQSFVGVNFFDCGQVQKVHAQRRSILIYSNSIVSAADGRGYLPSCGTFASAAGPARRDRIGPVHFRPVRQHAGGASTNFGRRRRNPNRRRLLGRSA